MAARLPIPKATLAAVVLAVLGAVIWLAWPQPKSTVDREALGLVTSLPIYWPDASSMDQLINNSDEVPWVRRELEESYELVPMDSLVAAAPTDIGGSIPPDSASPLPGLDRLLIVQPRAIGPADNVALDDWVRAGGRLLYVLDPMLAGQYGVPLWDPAHPVVSALIPPVFARWGLAVQFREAQPWALRDVEYDAGTLPVIMAGEFIPREPDENATAEELASRAECQIQGETVVVVCKLGKGQITAIADAALFELPKADDRALEQFQALINFAFEQ